MSLIDRDGASPSNLQSKSLNTEENNSEKLKVNDLLKTSLITDDRRP